MEQNTKRVFIACSLKADWPQQFPPGKILTIDNRHMTLAFLGNIEDIKLPILDQVPKPNFNQQPGGEFDKILALPKRKPRAMSYHARFTMEEQAMLDYQKQLIYWLSQYQFLVDDRPFLPHVTIARPPFEKSQWQHYFQPFTFLVTGIHLYESLGHRQFQILNSY